MLEGAATAIELIESNILNPGGVRWLIRAGTAEEIHERQATGFARAWFLLVQPPCCCAGNDTTRCPSPRCGSDG